jgi:addiction module HigA family antidote
MIDGAFAFVGSEKTHVTQRSWITTRRPAMPRRKIPPIHPGEILLEEYLKPLGLSQYRLAKNISVPARRVNEIVHGKRAITADTALRLARFFGTSDRFWLNLQTRYDLEVEKERLKGRLEREVSKYGVAS